MLIVCSHCQAGYELDTEVNDALFVCHRCGHEFSTGTPIDDDLPSTAPIRQSVHLLPWFIMLFTLIATPVIWFQYDAWMDNRALRSGIINLGFSLPLRDKDWFIVPESVHAMWIERRDGSKVFLISGQVNNLLSIPMLPPAIEIIFFSSRNPDQALAAQRRAFTFPPSNRTILQTPYPTPATDHQRIAGLGKREFVLLFESLPDKADDFSLSAKAR
ncbi:MAG: DUF3426 domain-containing protein [Mariprofundus sp.]|nr:DUF3426 domain-containing protein [Mariprofundus sp.]